MQTQHTAAAANSALKKQLDKRLSDNSLRSLRISSADSIDLCSNDYLGFAGSAELNSLIESQPVSDEHRLNGSTGSRLLTGNSALAEDLEKNIANYHKAGSGLIFNSGYDANVGLFSCIAQRNDTILYDELSHASIIDGIRLSYSNSFKFRHNDTDHLEELLKKAVGTVYVAVESVYSMDGDFAPLQEIAGLCKKYNAALIVDEAHATGIFGKGGEGRVVELGIENDVFARMHTFGKALGCHGAIVLGTDLLKQYLVNFSRPFIYSTALPQQSLLAVKYAYGFLENNIQRITQLKNNIHFFREEGKKIKGLRLIESDSAIQSILIGGNTEAKQAANTLQTAGYNVRPILSPTVAAGSERLRICLHSFNTEKEITGLLQAIELLIPSPAQINK
ncbi:MAG: 8-amino-7-oxononanoate synthase [Bacteroidetes bacterium]|nr:8-amino-7-oxononanoate synthase [Bacteroidota bacterium]